ncbi:hypothetical protein M529_23830 [Sphingobium ummariense RL-3]|uniref:Uncharacterized protein n=1 Tax=Sphingobium ummariense RL-3 TaxID=1346791 RepID=T0K8S9_9SPHN|nr:hypothetical protein [Sphingobium ummariense]EQB29813.1 hypothetical protein M529_23830 [Sphingobium ummariense RL-3]
MRWFADGRLNVSANCIDRHLAERADQVAILWEPDSPDRSLGGAVSLTRNRPSDALRVGKGRGLARDRPPLREGRGASFLVGLSIDEMAFQ